MAGRTWVDLKVCMKSPASAAVLAQSLCCESVGQQEPGRAAAPKLSKRLSIFSAQTLFLNSRTGGADSCALSCASSFVVAANPCRPTLSFCNSFCPICKRVARCVLCGHSLPSMYLPLLAQHVRLIISDRDSRHFPSNTESLMPAPCISQR